MAENVTNLVKAIAPELKDRPAADFDTFAEIADPWLDEGVWRSKYRSGLAYLIAHLMTISSPERGGAGGPVTSESVGAVSVSYGSIGDSEEELNSTAYGQTFVSLRKGIVSSPLVGGC